jgi:hypothetical protein
LHSCEFRYRRVFSKGNERERIGATTSDCRYMVTLGPSNVRDHFGSITYVARLLQNARDGFEGRAQRRRVADLDDVLEFSKLKD